MTGLTIREVVERTGVEAPTLRMWEQRHGFPDPERLPSGHRRYSQKHVELIRQVVRDRDNGLSLPGAIGQAKRAVGGGRPVIDDESIYAGLRRRRPDILPYVLPKRTLVAVSHAIEDECCARAERPMLFGTFQQEKFYRHAERRWRELAATAESAIVMADFDEVRDPPGGPMEIPIDRTDPVGREWSLICDAPGYSALLSGWERPGQATVPDSQRAFETIWSVEPELVRDAALVAAAIAERSVPDAADALDERLEEPVPIHADRMRLLGALTNRMVAYVGSSTRVSGSNAETAAATHLPAPHSSAGG